MKKVIKLSSVLLLIHLAGLQSFARSNSFTDTEGKEFKEIKNSLEQAIENRNFHDAKEFLGELFPLMKDDIKLSKKTLSGLKKSENPEINPEQYAKDLERKTELYESIKSLVDVSPAALRVKAEDLVTMIKEFGSLVNNT